MKNPTVPADNRARVDQYIRPYSRALTDPGLWSNSGERTHLDPLGQFGTGMNDCAGMNGHEDKAIMIGLEKARNINGEAASCLQYQPLPSIA